MVAPDKILDIRGSAGRRAAQLVRDVLGSMRSGEVLKLVTGGRLPRSGIVELCREEGYVLLDAAPDAEVFAFFIRR